MIKHAVRCLLKKGTLIIAHKNTKVHPSQISDWLLDWKFLPRNTNDLNKLFKNYCDTSNCKAKYIYDRNKHVFFFVLTKNREKKI
jgi:hypothetical protein